jgi:hypothetical protein
MSTPIKPPGSPDSPDPGGEVEGGGRADEPRGEFRSQVERASTANTDAAQGAAPDRIDTLAADMKAGRVDADGAIERIIERALANAAAMAPAHRAQLEAQLRAALAEDPALIALRKDLERASSGS